MEDLRRDASRRRSTPLGDDAWTAAQKQSGWWGELPTGRRCRRRRRAECRSQRPCGSRRRRSTAMRRSIPFHFLPYRVAAFLDGSLAHLPWLQEMPDPMTSAMWSSWVEINPKTAERLGIAQGDMVEVASSAGHAARAGVHHPGHRARHRRDAGRPGARRRSRATRRGRGVNPVAILAPVDRGRDRRAGVGGDARQDRARRRRRRHA